MIGTNTDDIKIVGIYGMGGIGKTTLAKVYNMLTKDFAYCCSFDDVRETANSKGILCLQNRLISVLSRGEDDGIMMIGERFSLKKALILLDDVGEKSQLIALLGRRCHFGPGSRILITTRNAIVLRGFDVKTYQLFSKHAFRKDHPPPEKLELSREIVKIAKGLPLAIETNKRLEALRLNFDQFWEDSLPLGEFAVLPNLRFLRVEGQLPQSLLIDSQSLNSGSGACNLKVLNLTNCSCLTKTPDLSGLLKLERLILDGCDRLARIDSSIGKLKNLIFLSLISCHELHSLPEELGGLPSLKELLLEGTSIREIPNWWTLEKLENPNTQDSLLVKTSGSIIYPTSSLNLALMDTPIVHRSDFIGALTSLERLNLRRCRHINRLPYLIGKLWSLTELDLFDSGIIELPDSMESLGNLKTLIVYTQSELKGIFVLPKLPVSLTSLAIVSWSMVTVPDLSDLINLNRLMLFMMVRDSSSLESVLDPLPWWVGRLSKLQTLALHIPHMTNLSPELGALSHLKYLKLWGCGRLQCIPQISSSISTLSIMSC
ncbi:hypothetical protein EUGRSUZ_C01921 [Eucalyptus grandis]|uniref:Uncharacterized protein n=2 Tax=Eucalyptus grandis TaxID=71139 RepID=A0A059CQW4_EUCGR|nr:hypothetical protein EUGRSUZ_C01921 [Eucalyptus grandis]